MPKLSRVSTAETGVRASTTKPTAKSGTSSRVTASETPDTTWKPRGTSGRVQTGEAETSGRVKTSEAETPSRVQTSETETPSRVKTSESEPAPRGSPSRVRSSE